MAKNFLAIFSKNQHMKQLTILSALFISCILLSCSEKDIYDIPLESQEQSSSVSISFSADQSTKAASVSSIEKIHIYMYHQSTGEAKYIYVDTPETITETLANGSWDIYVAANSTINIGSAYVYESYVSAMSWQGITEDLTKASAVDDLGLSYSGTIDISSDTNITIPLKRLVAKVNVNVEVASSATDDIVIESIQMMNVPTVCAMFKDNYYSNMSSVDYQAQSCSDGSSFTFYIPENMQGTNNAITSQTEKGGDNAPSNATYLHLTATVNGLPTEYDIFLGGNTTTDFNIRRNTEYDIDITLSGMDSSDWRVTAVDIIFTTDEVVVNDDGTVYSIIKVTSPSSIEIADVTFRYMGGAFVLRVYDYELYQLYLKGSASEPTLLVYNIYQSAWMSVLANLETNKEYIVIMAPSASTNGLGIKLTIDDYSKDIYMDYTSD